jgi:hypothetical protein
LVYRRTGLDPTPPAGTPCGVPPPLIPKREHFTQPERLSPAWTLTKGTKMATCEVWSHVLGFELRALVGFELVQSQVCRSQDEMIRVQEERRAAFGEGLVEVKPPS